MSDEPVILINLLSAKPGKQEALFELLRQSVDTVIRTSKGWRMTRLIASTNGRVVIYSEWDTPAAIDAMRVDPRMIAYWPMIAELARFESMVSSGAWSISRDDDAEKPRNLQEAGTAPAQMVVIYKRPSDVDAFERHYFETHIPLAKKIPGLRKYEVSTGPITTVAGPTNAHLIGVVHFDDLEALKAGFASPEGRAAAADRQLYAPDDSGVQMLVFETKRV